MDSFRQAYKEKCNDNAPLVFFLASKKPQISIYQ
jgi:hypothetical protein